MATTSVGYKKILRATKKLFPLNNEQKLLRAISTIKNAIADNISEPDQARISGEYGKNTYQALIDKYSDLPKNVPIDIKKRLIEISHDLFKGVPRWRSPKFLYNVGAAVNLAASSMYAVALDENIYSINDGLAGNVLVAESAVTNILAKLAKVKTVPYGVFTFGGTGTNLYAIKVGIRKALPESGKTGISKPLKVLFTEDAHFSHAVSADWLGIGTNNVEVITSNQDRTSNINDAYEKACRILETGTYLAAIILNGGTTYSQTIDDIEAFVKMRDKLIIKFKLKYKPHIHVDSVIGWAWLMFADYDFEQNPLQINKSILAKIQIQYNKINKIRLADSWGIDFHKGLGACPIDCSIVIMNDFSSMALLSKKVDKNLNMHQLAEEFSFFSPADYTLETSRAGGAPLAALTSLLTLGQSGYQAHLANLVEGAYYLRYCASKFDDFEVVNSECVGYVVMLQLYPLELSKTGSKIKDIDVLNKYNKEFFKWDLETRMKHNIGVEYSFSTDYVKLVSGDSVSAIKLYPVSPHFTNKYAKETIQTIKRQKTIFDETIWKAKE